MQHRTKLDASPSEKASSQNIVTMMQDARPIARPNLAGDRRTRSEMDGDATIATPPPEHPPPPSEQSSPSGTSGSSRTAVPPSPSAPRTKKKQAAGNGVLESEQAEDAPEPAASAVDPPGSPSGNAPPSETASLTGHMAAAHVCERDEATHPDAPGTGTEPADLQPPPHIAHRRAPALVLGGGADRDMG